MLYNSSWKRNREGLESRFLRRNSLNFSSAGTMHSCLQRLVFLCSVNTLLILHKSSCLAYDASTKKSTATITATLPNLPKLQQGVSLQKLEHGYGIQSKNLLNTVYNLQTNQLIQISMLTSKHKIFTATKSISIRPLESQFAVCWESTKNFNNFKTLLHKYTWSSLGFNFDGYLALDLAQMLFRLPAQIREILFTPL